MNASTLNPPSPMRSDEDLAVVVRSHRSFRLVVSRPCPAGTCLVRIDGTTQSRPNTHSVQVGRDEHVDAPAGISLEDRMDLYPFQFLNHSCEPNARIRGRNVIALRQISAGEQITFDYELTEFEMATPFACHCGARSCRSTIRGFRLLSAALQAELGPRAAPHIHFALGETRSPLNPTDD